MTDATQLLQGGARAVALFALLRCRDKEHFVQDALDHTLSESHLKGSDRRLAVNLVYSVMRRRGTLDFLLQHCCSRPARQVEPWLWDALRLGAAQFICMTHVPPHAAIFETVQLAEAMGKPSAKRFLNGVLRGLSRLLTDDRAHEPAADALPMESGDYRRLSRSVLPDPKQNPVQYLSIAFAFPAWLTKRWFDRFGRGECLRLGFWFCRTPSLWLRANRLRIARDDLVAKLDEAGVGCEAGELPEAIRLHETGNVRDLPGFGDGLFTVQDESAMRVAQAVDPRPGDSVLDICAAPGGKTTHLAELMNNEGRIVAWDIDGARLKRVAETCDRLGITIVETQKSPANDDTAPPIPPFDKVLVDAPCSNTGVIGRRPEIRWRLGSGDLQELIVLQTKLLMQGSGCLKPNGILVYSTCSIEPEENQGVVQTVLKALPNLELVREESRMPGQPSDGGYWARLRRKH